MRFESITTSEQLAYLRRALAAEWGNLPAYEREGMRDLLVVRAWELELESVTLPDGSESRSR